MNGTPFSVACSAACTAGQVASLMRIVPPMTAALKRGAPPNSPRLTAEVSIVCDAAGADEQVGLQARGRAGDEVRFFTPRRISARVASIATPEDSARDQQHAAVADGRDGVVHAVRQHRHVVILRPRSPREAKRNAGVVARQRNGPGFASLHPPFRSPRRRGPRPQSLTADCGPWIPAYAGMSGVWGHTQ